MLKQEEILNILREYKDLKKEVYHIKKLGLFGSYARNEADEQSDIDIVVDFSKPDLLNQVGIMQELRDIFDKKVDVIALWKRINPKLLARIKRDVIYV